MGAGWQYSPHLKKMLRNFYFPILFKSNINLKVPHRYTHPILFHLFSTVLNCFEMLHKHAQKLESHSYEKKVMARLSIFLIFDHEREATQTA